MNNAPCGFPVSNDLPQAVNAQYQPEKEVILVRQGLDAPAIFRCVAQELACAHITKGDYPVPSGILLTSIPQSRQKGCYEMKQSKSLNKPRSLLCFSLHKR